MVVNPQNATGVYMTMQSDSIGDNKVRLDWNDPTKMSLFILPIKTLFFVGYPAILALGEMSRLVYSIRTVACPEKLGGGGTK